MSEAELEQKKEKEKAITTARLQTLLHEVRKDEARIMRILEMRRLRRRLQAKKAK